MAYRELIKNFERIRDYMRQFYVYGFKSRSEYDAKSARSYDNERRRMESWMGDYMSFRQTEDGKNIFLSVDSRAVPANPLYKAFKAKSFTDGDLTLHFYILDLLADGGAYSIHEIVDAIADRYLAKFEDAEEMDVSSVRKKLREYEALGILKSEKVGRELRYSRRECGVDLAAWQDAIAFFSEAEPLGVIGSTLLDKYTETPPHFRFKHHYLLDALNAQIIAPLAEAIDAKRDVEIVVCSDRNPIEKVHRVYPMRIFVSTQSGRQHLLCYHKRFKKPMFFRADNIHSVTVGDAEPNAAVYDGYLAPFLENLWGVSSGVGFSLDHVELVICYAESEQYIPKRLAREKRCGRVEVLEKGLLQFTADVYDAAEMLPWIRTFIGRIVRFSCSDSAVEKVFAEDLAAMAELYGGDADAVS